MNCRVGYDRSVDGLHDPSAQFAACVRTRAAFDREMFHPVIGEGHESIESHPSFKTPLQIALFYNFLRETSSGMRSIRKGIFEKGTKARANFILKGRHIRLQ